MESSAISSDNERFNTTIFVDMDFYSDFNDVKQALHHAMEQHWHCKRINIYLSGLKGSLGESAKLEGSAVCDRPLIMTGQYRTWRLSDYIIGGQNKDRYLHVVANSLLANKVVKQLLSGYLSSLQLTGYLSSLQLTVEQKQIMDNSLLPDFERIKTIADQVKTSDLVVVPISYDIRNGLHQLDQELDLLGKIKFLGCISPVYDSTIYRMYDAEGNLGAAMKITGSAMCPNAGLVKGEQMEPKLWKNTFFGPMLNSHDRVRTLKFIDQSTGQETDLSLFHN